MALYHVYACNPVTGKRIVLTHANIEATTSFEARKAYAHKRKQDILDTIAVREDLDDFDQHGKPKPCVLDNSNL